MKTYLSIFVLAMMVIVSGCNSKHEKTAEEKAATEDSLKNAKAAELAEQKAQRKAQLKEAREMKEEQRRAALAEKAKASLTFKDASGKVVYYKSEVDPQYQGGNEAMMKYLRENVQYPEAAKTKGVEGTVFVDFIIDNKGKVRDVKASETTLDQVDSALIDEAVRVVSSMPAWVAGTKGGKPVDVAYSIPITFEIEEGL
ncbi:MAG: TonB family protein [Bacteroidota bacterium]